MHIKGFGLTDVGRKRDHNEDSVLLDAELGLFVVADGMGGHAAGEVASSHAVQAIRSVIVAKQDVFEDFTAADSHETRERLITTVEGALQRACAEIFSLATKDQGKAGMGTTLTMMLVVGDKALMAHVGDSRLYLVRHGQLHQLSEDHSYCSEMIKRGKMTREEARQSPYSNVITRAVGIQASVQVDTLLFDIIPNDTFLLCSDGLHGYMDDPNELVEILTEGTGDKAPSKLIDLANGRGGRDNITALVVRVESEAGAVAEEDRRAQEVNLKLETLKKIPLFRHLTYQELVKVLNITYLENHEAGSVIIRESEEGAELYVVLAGTVTVMKGGQYITDLGAGVHFGEMALIDQSPRSATIAAKETTRVLVVGRRAFYNLIRKEPVLAVKLLWSFVQVLSRRLRETNEQLTGARSELEQIQQVPFLEIDE
ncbi:MAG: Stp1/IreP family PP2C-type Ser/Thr phosphatase [Pseudomonadota bacterium]